MTTAYCTPAELRNQINLAGNTKPPETDTALNVIINAASQVVDRYFNRPDGFFVAASVASVRYYMGSGKGYQFIDACIEITKVEVKDSLTDTTYVTWTVDTDYVPFSGDPGDPNFNDLPYNGIMTVPDGNYSDFTSGSSVSGRGWSSHPDDNHRQSAKTVKVTAKWGYSASAPAAVREAVIAMSARWFKRGQSSWAEAVAASEMGTMLYSSKEWSDIKMMLDSMHLQRPSIGRN